MHVHLHLLLLAATCLQKESESCPAAALVMVLQSYASVACWMASSQLRGSITYQLQLMRHPQDSGRLANIFKICRMLQLQLVLVYLRPLVQM